MNTKPQTIDLTPRWQDIILAIVAAAPHSQDAKDELVRLAKYADETPALVQELSAKLAEKGKVSEPNWKARFFALADAVSLLSETSVYSPSEGCQIPTSEAWDHMENCAKRYSSDKPVEKLRIPSAVLVQQEGGAQ